MSWNAPPRSWEQVTGTWLTDAARSDTTAKTGSYSLHMVDTAVATKFRGEFIGIETNQPHDIAALVQTDDITAGYKVTIKAEEYQKDKSTSVATQTIYDAVLSATNTWEWVGAMYVPTNSNVRWVRVTLEKTTNTHNVYWDAVLVDRHQPLRDSIDTSGNQTVGSGSWTTITLNTNLSNRIYSIGDTTRIDGPSSNAITIYVPGYYLLIGQITIDQSDVEDGKHYWGRFNYNDGSGVAYPGSASQFPGANGSGTNDLVLNFSTLVYAPPGTSTVSLELKHNGSGSALVKHFDTTGITGERRTFLHAIRFSKI